MVRVSVVVCTLNRAPYLRSALASLAHQTAARDRFEVIVVDNGSVDDTVAVVEAARDTLADLTLLHEDRLGLSHARNAGMARARGTIVAFLDDDAEAAPSWVAALAARFAETPAAACVGGPVDAIWDAPRPPWLDDAMLPYLTVVDWGVPVGDLPEQRYLAGANVAFDAAQLRAVGGFSAALGRIGSTLLSNEELVVQRRLRARGGRCVWDPAVRVGHHVHPSRVRRGWFLRRYYWQGVSDAVMLREGLTEGAPALPSRRDAAVAALRWGAKAIVGGRFPRFACACEAVYEAAFAWHARRPRRSA